MMVTIRPLCADDIAVLQVLDAAAHGQAWSHATFADQIHDRARRHMVAVDRDDVVIGHGATWLDGHCLRVINVATAPAATGHGVATALLLHLLLLRPTAADTSDTQEIHEIDEIDEIDEIVLEVRPRNRRALRLYGRFGFAPAGVARDFYDRADAAGSRDAVVMRVDEPQSTAWQTRLGAISRQLAHQLGPKAVA